MRLAVEAVPRADRDHAPASDRWSVANVLEHVAVVETRVTSLLTRLVSQAKIAGLGPAPETSVVGDADRTRYLNRERPLVATKAARPASGLDGETAWLHLTRAREETVRLVGESDGLELTPIVFPHPVFGSLNFYQWIIFLGGHEGRHALQIQDVGRLLANRR